MVLVYEVYPDVLCIGRARSYDPMLGRWMNVDPLAEKYYSMSPYNNVGNDPIGYRDEKGEYKVRGNGQTVTRVSQGLATVHSFLSYSLAGSAYNITYKLLNNDPSYQVNAYDIGSCVLGGRMKGITKTASMVGIAEEGMVALGINETVVSGLFGSLANADGNSKQDEDLFVDEYIFKVAEKSGLGDISGSHSSVFHVKDALIKKLAKEDKSLKSFIKGKFEQINKGLRSLAKDRGYDLKNKQDRQLFEWYLRDGGANGLIEDIFGSY